MNGRRLYDEIGGVSERYLQEASAYRARRKSPTWRVALIAAALVLVGTLLLGTLAMSFGAILLGLGSQEQPQPPENHEQPAVYSIAKMESVLENKQSVLSPVKAENVPLFTGSAQLIWTDGESGEYYRVTLSEQELAGLLYLMQERQVDLDEDSEMPTYKIWISAGDGMVITPYLKADPGNAGHGELFDYDPELELSGQLIEQIIRCIET